ncbi:MAG: glycosyltransferase, partial [Pseudomonadota bacterium]
LGHYLRDHGEQLSANAKLTKRAFYEPIPSALRDRVHLVGYVDYRELPQIYAAGDLFLFCYLADNFPGAMTEVGLMERPMIALMKGGIPEIITREGQPLSLALTGEVEELIANQLVAHVRNHLGNPMEAVDLARQLGSHLRERFNVGHILSQMEAHYGSALTKKARHASLSTG